MSRTWSQGPIDIMMLQYLEDFNYLKGRTLVHLCSFGEEEKGYDRIRALTNYEFITSNQYSKRDFKKQFLSTSETRGKLFRITAQGRKALKSIKGEPITGNEKTTIEPDPELLPMYYSISAIIENIPLEFESAKRIRKEEKLNNFTSIDLIYNDWQLIVQRQNTKQYTLHLLQQCQITHQKNMDNIIILCPSIMQRNTLMRYWKENYGPNVRFLLINDYEGIARIIEDETPAEIEKAFEAQGIQIEELPQKKDNCTHIINGQLCTLIDLIGFPAREFRHLYQSQARPFVILSSFNDLQILTKKFPEHAQSVEGFLTLDGLSGTKNEIRGMLNR